MQLFIQRARKAVFFTAVVFGTVRIVRYTWCWYTSPRFSKPRREIPTMEIADPSPPSQILALRIKPGKWSLREQQKMMLGSTFVVSLTFNHSMPQQALAFSDTF